MTLEKGADGIYRGNFRFNGFDRLHLSMRTRKASEAKDRYAAVRRAFREKRHDVVGQLRGGTLSVERLTAMVTNGEPLSVLVATATLWPTVTDASADYVTWLREHPDRAEGTVQRAEIDLAHFSTFAHDGQAIGDYRLDRVPSAAWDAFRKHLNATYKPNTRRTIASRVRGLYTWHEAREKRLSAEYRQAPRMLYSPIDPETMPRGKEYRERWLTEAEAEQVLAHTPDEYRYLVAAGLFAGLRAEEILHLRPRIDVDLELGTIMVQPREGWTTKNKKRRAVPIAPPLLPVLERQCARYASTTWMMPRFDDPTTGYPYDLAQKRFRAIVAAAGLIVGRTDPRGVTLHTLRHTFASWLVQRGVDLYTVAQLLGNSIQMVEQVYGHLSPDHKKAAVARLSDAIKMPPATHTVTQGNGKL